MTHLVDDFYSIVANAPLSTDAMMVISVTVPEPGTWALLLTGLVALGCVAVLRKRQNGDGAA